MTHHSILTQLDLDEFKQYISDNTLSDATISIKNGGYLVQFEQHEDFFVSMLPNTWKNNNEVNAFIIGLKISNKPSLPVVVSEDSLIFGKDGTKNIVSCEVKDNVLELFIEKDGIITTETRENKYWLLASQPLTKDFKKLDGGLHYQYIKYYDSAQKFYTDKRIYKDRDTFSVSDNKEASMILNGFTYYKGMKLDEVSRMHFDLETTGLTHDDSSRVLLISTTFVKNNIIKKRLFSCDEYVKDGDMIEDFCKYIRDCDPSIIAGFNIFSYDFPYLSYCAKKNDVKLLLGRDASSIKYNNYTSKFRKDGSQSYEYTRCFIYGREIVDMWCVSIHFDVGRKYDSYKLKKIIEQEGLEKSNRQFYDASQIYKNWDNLEERKKIKEYCIDDSDDSESLFKLMIPSFFYFTQYIPKTFQIINCTASGSQLNAFMIRGYLQDNHSIPKADQAVPFEGAISFGVPGIYNNVLKLDFAAYYPNIIRSFNIFSKEKDPKAYLPKVTNFFTEYRIKNKNLFKETNDRYYYEMEQSTKIIINSLYGLLGSVGLNFNYPLGAARITEIAREILKFTILWSTSKNLDYWTELFNAKTGKPSKEGSMQDL